MSLIPEETVFILWVVLLVVNIGIFLPVAVYSIRKFYSMPDSIMIKKRYPEILKIQAILIIVWFSVGAQLLSAAMSGLYVDIKGVWKEILPRVSWSFAVPVSYAIFVCAAWRFWHIFFDLKHASSLQNSQWKYHLNPELVDHNFWLTHKKDLGSYKWVMKFLLIFVLVVVLIIIIGYQSVINQHESHIMIAHGIGTFFYGVANVTLIISWWKVPKYSDNFFIRDEMKLIGVTFITEQCIGSVCVVFGFVFFGDSFMLFAAFTVSILFFTLTIISYWVFPRKIFIAEAKASMGSVQSDTNDESSVGSDTNKSYDKSTGNTEPKHHTLHIGRIIHHISNHKNDNKKSSYNLHSIITHKPSFKLFMQHLAKEFSAECLLCFVEIVQFKYAMQKRFDIVNADAISAKHSFVADYPLSDVVPISIINQNGFKQDLSQYRSNDDPLKLMTEAKHICLELYRKYISDGSELQVNIAYATKKQLDNLMKDESFFMNFNFDPNDLFTLYDTVVTTMFTLMYGSFGRFKQSTTYENAIKELHDHYSLT